MSVHGVICADGYTEDEVVYLWASEPPVKKYKDITMAQFNLTDIEHGRRRTSANHGIVYTSALPPTNSETARQRPTTSK